MLSLPKEIYIVILALLVTEQPFGNVIYTVPDILYKCLSVPVHPIMVYTGILYLSYIFSVHWLFIST